MGEMSNAGTRELATSERTTEDLRSRLEALNLNPKLALSDLEWRVEVEAIEVELEEREDESKVSRW